MAVTHLVFDIETLSVKERSSVILSLAVVPFTFEGNESYDDLISKGFYRKIDAMSQLKSGRAKSKNTIEWWQSQSHEAQLNGFLPNPDEDVNVYTAFRECAQWIKNETDYDFKKSWIWSRGAAFDFPKIEYNFDDAEIDSPVNFWMVRDIRTMIDCFTGSIKGNYVMRNEPASFVKHHCLHDAAHDAAVMREIFANLSE